MFFTEATRRINLADGRHSTSVQRTGNEPHFNAGLLPQQPIEDEIRFSFMIENDASVMRNYERLASQALEDIFVTESREMTLGEFRDKTVGDVRDSLQRIFPSLRLNDFGNLLTDGTFRFDKGASPALALASSIRTCLVTRRPRSI